MNGVKQFCGFQQFCYEIFFSFSFSYSPFLSNLLNQNLKNIKTPKRKLESFVQRYSFKFRALLLLENVLMYLRFHKLQLYCNPLQTLSNITISRRSIKKNNLKNNILFNIHCFIKLKIFCFDSLNNEREKMSNWSHLKKYYNLNTPCKISSPVQCCLEQ